jgi:GNAT-family acetyltransferase (TIGR03103 family)
MDEQPHQRDILFYVEDPHILISRDPQNVFVDPSFTFRMWLNLYRPKKNQFQGFTIRRVSSETDLKALDLILHQRQMMPIDTAFVWRNRKQRQFIYMVAEDSQSGAIIGGVMGIDHKHAFKDIANGCSLWCLAVCPNTNHSGVGEALTRYLIEHYKVLGRNYLDLSVLHTNKEAIRLYKKIGFQKAPIYCVKRKNVINESLYIAPQSFDEMNPYAKIIIDEARRRGIHYEIVDANKAIFELRFGGSKILCHESLSETTPSTSFVICQDKELCSKVLKDHGFNVPQQKLVKEDAPDAMFLKTHKVLVVKPVNGEQGKGIRVGVKRMTDLRKAIHDARKIDSRVILEQFVSGHDIRIIVINYEVVAVAERRPGQIMGNDRSTIHQLIENFAKRRQRATQGESRVIFDKAMHKLIRDQGYKLDDIPKKSKKIYLRKTANLHTGGTIHDITSSFSPELKRVAEQAAQVLKIPVVGFDFIVPDLKGSDYVIIEANERPGLANHEPQPTAERFIDFLFPQSATHPPQRRTE